PTDFDTMQKLQFILNKDIQPVLAPREQIVEAINRHYGQTETESVDSMLQEFTDTAIDFTETEATQSGTIGDEADAPPSSWSTSSLPRRSASGPAISTSSRSATASASATGSTACWSNATARPAASWPRSSLVSKSCRKSTYRSAAGPRTAVSR